ncbi:RUN and FYVE domain-containing protein 1 [Wickerhamomyces ciferrii]|uniref:RUN and FYVE domain-containing protein 1 n=1 Tax=Wickerhamomyces ciferrii (strain ATCC 14091 / BCRC 22168 / CBS 111 / JCM 3599 / NBRC 0793 / NRRL Y-1031 F-60-10) TaxID=1206466 RepID=K0KNC3_WICCF|nr:RUN and FYVE domain-containing protein 1 [Wickerhamomyces ciferrii]CCH44491.1 RUN and FYVE domain-containing protein 1 [Wickerhamomyces ciferrii]
MMEENGTIDTHVTHAQQPEKQEHQQETLVSHVSNQQSQVNVNGNVNDNVKHGGNAQNSSAIEEKDLPSEITFEKRSIPKSRTQSVQSVLSSVSLRSFVQNNHLQQAQQQQAQAQAQQQQQQGNGNGAVGNSTKPFLPPSHKSSAKLVDTSSYIQAPATAASSKRRASFEIGQRLPFNQEPKDDAVESDGELEVNEEQKKLTDDALRRLSSFSKFQPAEVDLTPQEPIDTHEQVLQSSSSINSTSQLYMNNYHSRENSTSSLKKPSKPQLSISNSIQHSNSFHRPGSSPLLSRKPQINPSPAAQLRDSRQSFTTLNQLPKQPKQASQQSQPQQQQQQQQQQQKQPQQLQLPSLQQNGTQVSQQQQFQQQLRPTQMSKTNSTSSQRTIDDTSSLRTINDPKRPMYIPAVLRQSPTNLKPEDLKFINELKTKKLISSSPTKPSSFQTNSSLSKTPTKTHWKKDDYRDGCALCSKKFTFFERRHHCRHCGDLYCSEHLSNHISLNLNANFTMDFSNSLLCKVCDLCIVEYEGFIREKLGSFNSTSVNDNEDGNNDSNVNVNVNGNGKDKVNGKKKDKKFDSFVGSIPADWSWSSF